MTKPTGEARPGAKALSVIGLLRAELGYVKRLTPAIANEIHLAIEDIAKMQTARPREAALEAALAAIRRYPNIETYIGTDLCDMADAALQTKGEEESGHER